MGDDNVQKAAPADAGAEKIDGGYFSSNLIHPILSWLGVRTFGDLALIPKYIFKQAGFDRGDVGEVRTVLIDRGIPHLLGKGETEAGWEAVQADTGPSAQEAIRGWVQKVAHAPDHPA